jgi:hypothetical protein
MKLVYLLLTSFFLLVSSKPARAEEAKNNVQLSTVVDACRTQANKDKICEALISLQQIGDDSIEAVKEYIDLSPRSYAILTAVNAIASGRLRIRTKSFVIKNANHTYDLRRDKAEFLFEMEF